ncbi:hypothetical protein HMPREF1862_01274 [Varibaculum cambriense]|uniref:Uncharacterized protein n=1 Tax=Varibaculum cambriense TaxID=184870 RepID=A0AB34X184_9ACTO|nr:hypothetical protein HMPREF1862_01274 [Varibaculum cambriense]
MPLSTRLVESGRHGAETGNPAFPPNIKNPIPKRLSALTLEMRLRGKTNIF